MNGKKSGLKTIDIYQKNLKIATSRKIKILIEKQKAYIRKYGQNGKKTITLNRKIDREIKKINSKQQ